MKQISERFILFIILVFCLMATGLNWAFCEVERTLDKFLMKNSVDVWDAFLKTLERRGLSDPHWEIEPTVQEELITYFKAKIDAGVSDGLTSLPPDLPNYVHRFPKEMRHELRSHTESALEADPINGAAAKFLAIETFCDINAQKPIEKYPLVDKAMMLVSNDIEICFFAYATCTRLGDQMNEKALVSLEKLFERLRGTTYPIPYRWVLRLYGTDENLTTPSLVYKQIESNDPLIERWRSVLNEIPAIFEREWPQKPDSYVFYIVAYVHETLGNNEAAEAVFKQVQPVFEKRLERNPNDGSALGVLAGIHERFGNPELAREYRVRENPSLAWEGEVLHDFLSTVDLDGKPISLADYRGKVVLLDFWATWCQPCVAAIPNIKTVYEKYHNKGFDVIGISLDVDETVLREFIEENPLPWGQIFDGKRLKGPLAQRYGIRSIPRMFLLDREGKVISVGVRSSTLDKLVAEHLEGEVD